MSDERALEHLDEALKENELRVRQSIGSGFRIWQSKAGSYIAYCLVLFLISFILGLIPILGQIGNSILIAPALTLGAYMYTHKVERDDDVEFGNFFDGFKFIGTIAIARILIYIVIILLSILLFRNMFDGNWMSIMTGNTDFLTAELMDEDFEFSDFINVDAMTWVFLIPLLLCSMMIFYTECFIGFFGLSAMDAIKYSCQFVLKNLFKIIILNILIGLIAISGVIGIIVGMLITFSMIYPMFYRSFSIMTDLDNYLGDDEYDMRIEDNLVGE